MDYVIRFDDEDRQNLRDAAKEYRQKVNRRSSSERGIGRPGSSNRFHLAAPEGKLLSAPKLSGSPSPKAPLLSPGCRTLATVGQTLSFLALKSAGPTCKISRLEPISVSGTAAQVRPFRFLSDLGS